MCLLILIITVQYRIIRPPRLVKCLYVTQI